MSYNSDLTSSYLDSFTIEELNLLLRKYRQSIKKIMDKIRDKQRDIYETENFRLGNLISIEMNLLNNLGFVSNQIYKDEANLISKKFVEYYDWSNRHGRYSNELLATCIISEIFDYYKVQYSIDDLLSIQDIELDQFMKLKNILNNWSKKYYWKK